MLQLWLLGQFDVRVDGKRTVLGSRAAESLLAFLVLNPGTAHRRERLAGMFWPEMPDENARGNLRHHLWRVRKALTSPQSLDPARAQSPRSDCILADELTIAFNSEADYWLDVAQLARPAAPDASTSDLISSLTLYRGELLPGFYDDWAALERERVQGLFETRMQELLERLIGEQRWLTVLEWAERWIALGQTPEPAYRALMIAHAAQGDMSKVALDYERCVERLREDMEVEPSADTRALYETLAGGGKADKIGGSVPPILVQPSGTVTFLFSDIEGSTKLLEKLGSDYATLLADQRDLLRGTAEKFHGHEVDTQGDAFFFAFFRAGDAAAFAAEAQRALAAHAWPQGATLRVRMGLHTGEPMLARTGYVGLDVHRAARIGSAGHGGQVLMSRTTRDLVEQDLPAGTQLDDLGEHQLKDLRYPVHIIQLTIEGLPSNFPPLKVLATGSEPPAPGDPPFKGMEYFDEDDADLFFGREQLTAKLVGRLRDSRFLAVVVGASGSGKSSIVRAGVIPALRKGEPLADGTLPPMDSQNWRIHVMTPTAHPLVALATELTRDVESVTATATLMDDLARDPRALYLYLRRRSAEQTATADRRPPTAEDGSPSAMRHPPFAIRQTLVVIDQFEELFTLCHDELEREQFVDNLLTALSDQASGLVTLVLTLRADFYAHLAQYPELRDQVAQHQEYIGPMTVEELRRAIEEPAKQRRAQDGEPWEFEPGLVDLYLRDVGDEPGALPLLSHALLETWKRRSGHTLTLKGYHEAGGVRGAIAQTAETTYQLLSPEQQVIARELFLRLTELGEGTEDTRRRASFNELIPRDQNAALVRGVLVKLADARLITTSADSAEVAHEALIREWDRLREWLNQGREGLRLHRQLTEAANDWQLLERDPGALYRGARLAAAVEFANANPNALNQGERAFLEASQENEEWEAREREEARQRELLAKEQLLEAEQVRVEQEQAANRQLRRRALFLAGAFGLALGLAALALFLGDQSNRNAAQAQQNALAATHAEATAVANAAAAHRSEEEAVRQQRITLSRELAGSAINNLEVDPERSILLAMQAVSTTYAVDGTTTKEAADALHRAVQNSRQRLAIYPHPGGGYGLAFSPDGKGIATSSIDGQIQLWDLASRKEQFSLSGHDGLIYALAFSPDGSHLASASIDGTAKVWDLNTRELIHDLRGHTDEVSIVSYSKDGERLVTASSDGTARVWDAESGEPLLTFSGHGAPVLSAQFSPDGTRIASAGDDYVVRVWDSTSGQEIYMLSDFELIVSGAAFSPDGKVLATSGGSDPKLWDAETGSLLYTLPGGSVGGTLPAFTPDGKYVAVGGQDGRVSIWETATGREYLTFATGTPVDGQVEFSPECVGPPTVPYTWCGMFLLTGNRDGSARLWDVSPAGDREVMSVPGISHCLAPDGNIVHTVMPAGDEVKIHSWRFPDLASVIAPGDPLPPPGHELSSHAFLNRDTFPRVIFTPDCSRNAVLDHRNLLATINDTASGKELLQFNLAEGTPQFAAPVAFSLSPDGTRLAELGPGNTATVYDIENEGRELLTLDGHTGLVMTVSFSPDGKQLATTSQDMSVKLWDAETGEELKTLTGQTHFGSRVVFSPDGTRLASGSFDRTVRIWDLATGKEVLNLSGHTGTIWAIAFSPDGRLIATSGNDTRVRLWDAKSGEPLLTLPLSAASFKVSFSPDGTRFVASSMDGVTQVFLTDIEDEYALARSRVTRGLTTEECREYLHVEQCPGD
jgi:WD40 repeat protein/class 3 adenylate cyclase